MLKATVQHLAQKNTAGIVVNNSYQPFIYSDVTGAMFSMCEILLPQLCHISVSVKVSIFAKGSYWCVQQQYEKISEIFLYITDF